MNIKQKFEQLKKANDQDGLLKFYKKYEPIFIITAKTLCNGVTEAFKLSKPELKVNPVIEVVGNYFEMQKREDKNSCFQGTISTSIAVREKSKFDKIVLIKNSSAEDEEMFQFAQYEVNIFPLLLNDNLVYADIIHKGCWNAVKENLKEIAHNLTT